MVWMSARPPTRSICAVELLRSDVSDRAEENIRTHVRVRGGETSTSRMSRTARDQVTKKPGRIFMKVEPSVRLGRAPSALATLIAMCLLSAQASAAESNAVYQFNLPEQTLSEALKAIGRQ